MEWLGNIAVDIHCAILCLIAIWPPFQEGKLFDIDIGHALRLLEKGVIHDAVPNTPIMVERAQQPVFVELDADTV